MWMQRRIKEAESSNRLIEIEPELLGNGQSLAPGTLNDQADR